MGILSIDVLQCIDSSRDGLATLDEDAIDVKRKGEVISMSDGGLRDWGSNAGRAFFNGRDLVIQVVSGHLKFSSGCKSFTGTGGH